MQPTMNTTCHWKTILLTGLLSLLTAGTSFAQQMNYQGRLTDASGNAVPDAQYSITFNIFSAATGGTALWGPQGIQADTVQGRFNVILGPTDTSSRSIVNAFTSSSARYLQITFQGNAILPRQPILSAPSAFNAAQADYATVAGAVGNGGSSVINILNGKVGIGTSSPATTLHVSSASDTELSLQSTANNRRWTLQASAGADGVGQGGTFQIVDRTAVAARLVIGTTGNVGIGVSTPTAALEVAGTVKATSLDVRSPSGPATLIVGNLDNGAADNEIRFQSGYGFLANTNDITSSITISPDNTSGGKLVFLTTGTDGTLKERVRIDVSGYVGIGTLTPQAPLEVKGVVTQAADSGYQYASVSSGRTASLAAPVSILSQGYVQAFGFFATSDQRIKDVVGVSDSRKDLAAIQKLKVTDYRMKDRVAHGGKLHQGFLAQEVQSIIPEAVNQGRDFIPDIYAVADQLKFDQGTQTLRVSLAKAHKLRQGDKVRLIADGGPTEQLVTGVPDAHTFIVGSITQEPKRLFVYGRQVDDFLSVDYNRIFTMGIGAIQQLKQEKDAEIQSLTQKNATLQHRLSELEAKTQANDNRLAALEKLLRGVSTVRASATVRPAAGE